MSDLYVVKVESPTPTWIRIHQGSPCFTHSSPAVLSYEAAMALKRYADRCCGGTLHVVIANA